MKRSLNAFSKILLISALFVLSSTNPHVIAQPIPPDAWRFDFNGDGKIDAEDVLNFLTLWQLSNIPTPTSPPSANESATPTLTPFPTSTPTQMEISPYFNSIPPGFGLVGEQYVYLINASDPNGDSLTYSILSGPNGMGVSTTGHVTWTPSQTGPVEVSLGITDGKTDVVYQDFTIHVGLAETAISAYILHLVGGVVEVDDPDNPIAGTRIEIPPSSLPEDATVTIRAVSDANEYVPEALPVEIDGLPSGVTATIELPYDPDLLAMYGGSVGDLVIIVLDPATGEWVEVQPIATKVNKLGIPTVVGLIVGAEVAYVATHKLYLLTGQPRRIEAVKGSLADFFMANSSPPKQRLVVIHGLISDPQTFNGPDDFLSSTGNLIQESLFASYDSIVTYRYPSGLRISQNAQLFQQRLIQGYNGIPANSIFSIYQNPSFKFDILCHSMGGLISRYAIEKTPLAANLGRLVTLGTPHGGFQTKNELINHVFGTAAPIVLAPFPGITDLLIGSSLLSALNNGKTSPDVFFPPGGQRYYCAAGLKDGSLISSSDGVVTKNSALFLNLSAGHERIFGDDEPEGPANQNYSHNSLHSLAANNSINPNDRVGDQVLSWLGSPGVAPAWTPTPTIPHPIPTATPTLPETVGPRTEPVEYSQYQHLIHVAKSGSDTSGDGSAESPWASLTYALTQVVSANAANRYAILVAGGIYAENGLMMKEWADMYGGYDPDDWSNRDISGYEAVINGGGLEIVVVASNTRLDGFTLTGGSRAIHADSVSPLITNNVIKGNSSSNLYGGGIYCEYSSPVVLNNRIENNSTRYGGGGICLRYCTSYSTISRNIIGSNTALAGTFGGGGLYVLQSDAKIAGNTIVDNLTDYHGGGIFCNSSSAVITNNTICRNLTDDNDGEDGGGIYAAHSEGLLIVNCTLWGNRADHGGGVYVYSTDVAHMLNTVVYGNLARIDQPQFGQYLSGATVRYCDIEGSADISNNNISDDPLFVAPGDYNFHLTALSPCIDKGHGPQLDPDVPSADIEGDPRGDTVGGRDSCDIGADEFVAR
jgi:hypothetical protein